MKFSLTFKTPDVTDQLNDIEDAEDRAKAESMVEKFLEYGEYITVEFDTESQSATVKK